MAVSSLQGHLVTFPHHEIHLPDPISQPPESKNSTRAAPWRSVVPVATSGGQLSQESAYCLPNLFDGKVCDERAYSQLILISDSLDPGLGLLFFLL